MVKASRVHGRIVPDSGTRQVYSAACGAEAGRPARRDSSTHMNTINSGGMISLAQWLIFGFSGFMIGNAVAEAGHGLKLGWNPWVAVVFALE